MLGVLRALSVPPTLRDAVIATVQRRVARPASAEGRDITKLETQLARLKDMYQMGDIEKPEYLKRREALQHILPRACNRR